MKIQQRLIRFSTLSLAFAGLVACGASQEPESELKVTNGRVIAEKAFPAVFQIEVSDSFGRSGTCTATFVTDSIALTAAHCVNTGRRLASGQVEGNVRFVESQGGESRTNNVIAESTSLYQHPEWSTSAGVSSADLGIIVFPEGTARAVVPLRKKAPKVGEKLTIVGYGINDYMGRGEGSSGVKRLGENEVDAVEEGFIKFAGTPANTDESGIDGASGSGDSGGPLFIDGELVGTTSGGGVRDGLKHSLYVDLTTKKSQDFLAKFLN